MADGFDGIFLTEEEQAKLKSPEVSGLGFLNTCRILATLCFVALSVFALKSCGCFS